jgi:hypothetical protein
MSIVSPDLRQAVRRSERTHMLATSRSLRRLLDRLDAGDDSLDNTPRHPFRAE